MIQAQSWMPKPWLHTGWGTMLTAHTCTEFIGCRRCCTILGTVVLCNVPVAYPVFFVLRIKSVRFSGCLLYSLYFERGSGPLDPRWQSIDCWLFDTCPSGVLNYCSCLWCLASMRWCMEVVIAWTVESWYGYGSIEHSEVHYWVAFGFQGQRKAKPFWAGMWKFWSFKVVPIGDLLY